MWLLAGLGLLQTGCLNWSYGRIELGAGPADYDRVLPMEDTRQTPLGFCYVGTNRAGRVDAFVVQVGVDRRVVAKWQATYDPGDWFDRMPSYRLRGMYDPSKTGLDQASLQDVVRMVLSQLGEIDVDQLQREAHGWIAAGLVRIGESFDGFAPADPLTPETETLLQDAPPGGDVEAYQDEQGVMHFRYEVE